MRMLGISALVGTTLLALAAPAVAHTSTAQAPPPPAAGTVTTVRTDCLGGGTFVVKQTQLASGQTHVDIRGKGVPNGRWKGSFSPDASTVERDTDLAVTATGHTFHVAVDVSGVTGDTNTTLLRGSVAKACAIGLTLTKRTISVSSPIMVVVSRSPKPGTLTTAGIVLGCDKGSTWKYAASAEFGDTGLGFGAGGIPCRKNAVKVSKTTTTFEPPVAGKPGLLKLVARSHGDVRTISYKSVVAS